MKVWVTGATGFVGGALARRLKHLGATVTASGRNGVWGQRLETDGIRFLPANLGDLKQLARACEGSEAVFHCGALSSPWGRYLDFYRANVEGTQNVIRVCGDLHVQRLVHVSTPSLYFGYEDRLDVAESDPVADPFTNHYAATKWLAEQAVVQAHQDGLPTVTIRPRAIFGPGDTALFPRLLSALRRGRLHVIGDGANLADLTHIDNVVDALLRCAEAPERALGRVYNISSGEPIRLWDRISWLCRRLGYPPPGNPVPYARALKLAGALEFFYKTLLFNREPPLTRYTVTALAKSQTLNIEAARRDLGYAPAVDTKTGLLRLVAWWKAHGHDD